jgi:uncharacterized protein
MNTSLFKALPPFTKLLFFGGMVLIGFGVGTLAVMLVAVKFAGLSIESLPAFFSSPDMEHIELVKWMNNIAQLFGFIVPVVLFALVFGMRDVSRLMLRKPNFYLFTGALWVMGATGVITALGWLNTLLIPQGSGLEQLLRPQEESAAHLTQLILSATGPWAICSTVITVAIVPALAEEFVFRGVVQPLIARSTQRIHLSVWLTAALFSFIHFQFYGFLPRLVLGAMLGYLVIWSGTIWTSVVAHATNNLMAVVAYRNG